MAAGRSTDLKKIAALLLRSTIWPATLRAMNVKEKYRGRLVTDADVAFISQLITCLLYTSDAADE